MMRAARFEILGPVRGWRGEAELDLGSPQQRAVLAMLLLARGRQVGLASLIDGLWGAQVPRSAAGTVRTYISRLRRHSGPDMTGWSADLIESAGDGYVLRPGAGALDLDAFDKLHYQARAARKEDDAVRASRLLREALGLWRGTALAGIPGPYAESRRVPLSELRLTATEDKLAAEIEIGEHAAAVAELRMLLDEHPFREGLGELLMLALYKAGRQAEALDVFDRVRQRLRGELGIDPGPSLQVMHQRVLRADRDLMTVGPCSVYFAGAVGAPLVA